MASLNAQGIMTAVVMVSHIPFFFFALRICFRHGIREMAWLFLLIFSLIRIAGCALVLAAESIVPAVTELYIGGYALEASGSSLLLLSALGLIEIVTEGQSEECQHQSPFVFRILQIVGIVALVLTFVGISSSSSSSGGTTTEHRVGGLFLAGLYIVLVVVIARQWVNLYRLMKYRKQLLAAVAKSLPILLGPILASVLSAFSSRNLVMSTTESNNFWPRFNMFFLEYQVMLIYAWAGSVSRLDQDSELQQSDDYPLHPRLLSG